MNIENKLKVVEAGWCLLPFILPLLLIRFLPRPRQWGWRAIIAALGSSLVWILYTTELYHPLYHAVSWQRGENPNVRFDSDELDAIRYFLAWVVPAAVVLVAAVWRAVARWLRSAGGGSSVPRSAHVVGDF